MDRVRKIEHRQRTTARIPMKICPGLEISVCLYTSIRKAVKPNKQKLYKRTNEEVKMITKEYSDTGELLMPSDFAKYVTHRGTKIKFTPDEVRSMTKIHPPGLEILGFKPRSSLTPDMYVHPAHFISPSEEDIKGSSPAFTGLLSRCHAKGVVAIARVVARANAKPDWAAMLPQEEEKDEDGNQIRPAGFHLCYLPYADDARVLEMEDAARAAPSQVDAAKALVTKLSFRYNPLSFDNPALQTHWRNVEALALNRTRLEPIVDYTAPDPGHIRKRTGPLVEKFKSEVWPHGFDPEKAAKKAAASSYWGAASYKAAAPRAPAPASVEQALLQNSVEKLTVGVLRSWLEGKGLKTSGKKKAELVSDVYDA